jgi:hypothetical protein
MSRYATQVLKGTWRGLQTGVDPMYSNPEWADGATDQPGDPGAPIETPLEGGGGMVLPWFDAHEDPTAATGLYASMNPTPWVLVQDAGGQPVAGAYEPAVKTRGPVYQWGHEPSGGLMGDQAMARIMRFPANKPERYDPNGVQMPSYSDELAAAIATNGMGVITESEYTTELINFPGVG